MPNEVKMLNRVVHVGYPKAGSSFLQSYIFPKLKNYEIINYTRGKKFTHYVMNSGMFFDPEKAAKLIGAESDNLILTDEVLIGNPINGKGVNDETVPVKLKMSGFNKVIIIARRDSEKWERSLYNEFIKLGGKLSYKDWLANPSRHDSEYTWYNPGMILHCNDYCNYFKKVFGSENVLVLYIEDVRTDQKSFTSSILNFLGTEGEFETVVPRNESMPSWIQFVVRILNNFTSSRMSPSSNFRMFSTNRVIRVFQLFTRKSITKYR
jgi:hypothetical protein